MIDLPTCDPVASRNAVVHQVFQYDVDCGLVEHLLVEFVRLILNRLRVTFIFLKLLPLLVRELRILDASASEIGGERLDLEVHEEGAIGVGQSVGIAVMRRGVFILAAEQRIGVPGNELHRRGGEAHLKGIEVQQQIAVAVVDAAVRLVANDEIKEANVKRLVDFHHRGVSCQINAVLSLLVGICRDVGQWFIEIPLEVLLRLFSQFATIRQKQDSACPSCLDQGIAQRNCHTRLPCSRRQDNQSLAVASRKSLCDTLDRFNLVHPVCDPGVDLRSGPEDVAPDSGPAGIQGCPWNKSRKPDVEVRRSRHSRE